MFSSTFSRNINIVRFIFLASIFLQPIAAQVQTGSDQPPCYDICDNAVLYAESIGDNPRLCGPDSSFLNQSSVCVNCLTNNTNNREAFTVILPEIASFVSYCKTFGQASTIASKCISTWQD